MLKKAAKNHSKCVVRGSLLAEGDVPRPNGCWGKIWKFLKLSHQTHRSAGREGGREGRVADDGEGWTVRNGGKEGGGEKMRQGERKDGHVV